MKLRFIPVIPLSRVSHQLRGLLQQRQLPRRQGFPTNCMLRLFFICFIHKLLLLAGMVNIVLSLERPSVFCANVHVRISQHIHLAKKYYFDVPALYLYTEDARATQKTIDRCLLEFVRSDCDDCPGNEGTRRAHTPVHTTQISETLRHIVRKPTDL